MWTVSPSKATSPESAWWIPATHLIRVDLPAPLSPTRAITSPGRTSKSTSLSAWTEPKLFEIPWSSSRGVGAEAVVTAGEDGGGTPWRRPPPDRFLVAELRVLADADLAPLQIPVEEDLVVLLRDRHRRDDVRRQPLAAVRHRARLPGLLTLQQRDSGGRRDGRTRPLVLPDGHRLPAGDDVLHALRSRILAAERDRLQLPSLQCDDDGVRETVVGRRDALDVVARLHEHLLEDRPGLLVVPARRELLRALLERPVLVERVQDRLVPALEEERVVVGLAAVQLRDDRLLRVQALRLQARHDALALQHADRLAVPRDVDLGAAADHLAVVLDHLRTARPCGGLDCDRGALVERDQDDDLRAVGEALVGLRLLPLGITVGVGDHVRDSGLLEGRHEAGPVLRLPTHGRLGIRQQHADLSGRRTLGRLRDRAGHGHAHRQRRDRQHYEKLLHDRSLHLSWTGTRSRTRAATPRS